ncbi:hypothetical protein LJB85_02220 [Porphyromonadaceae bacterium OttesenSCG-928-L07]|nr:hypothetical protein [Porphyromonadaceae bacterium OttesenSCG-928-L07]MDL2251986.1 hypothetical protein [Odoribacter sp. OttesenSCG-928-J03]MDL2330818.1 hypothetical protein [Odoribacter sp. OttesenSCG-928-A06]
MNKILYSVCAILFLVTSCTDFDSEKGMPFVEGPSVTITASNVGDSTFTFKLSPDGEASYYSYLVVEADQAEELDPVGVLKTSAYSGLDKGTIKYADNKDKSIVMAKLKPNTAYQVYAAAQNTNGMVGELTSISVRTTDGINPQTDASKATISGHIFGVTFSETIQAGTMAFYVSYYPVNNLAAAEVGIEIPADSISIEGTVVSIALPDAPAGANVCITWEAGAVRDLNGNDCVAYTTEGYDPAKKAFKGVTARVATKSWKIQQAVEDDEDDDVIAFTDWQAFMMEFIPEAAYVKTSAKGKVQVVYVTEGKEITLMVPSRIYGMLDDTTFVVMLPEEPERGAIVNLSIPAGSLEDKYGNPSEKLEVSDRYMYSYGYTIADIVGTYSMAAISAANGAAQSESGIEIVKDVASDTILIKNLLSNLMAGLPVTTIKALFDTDKGILTIFDWQDYGISLNLGGAEPERMYFAAYDEVDLILNVPSAGRIESSDIWGHLSETFKWARVYATTVWTRVPVTP